MIPLAAPFGGIGFAHRNALAPGIAAAGGIPINGGIAPGQMRIQHPDPAAIGFAACEKEKGGRRLRCRPEHPGADGYGIPLCDGIEGSGRRSRNNDPSRALEAHGAVAHLARMAAPVGRIGRGHHGAGESAPAGIGGGVCCRGVVEIPKAQRSRAVRSAGLIKPHTGYRVQPRRVLKSRGRRPSRHVGSRHQYFPRRPGRDGRHRVQQASFPIGNIRQLRREVQKLADDRDAIRLDKQDRIPVRIEFEIGMQGAAREAPVLGRCKDDEGSAARYHHRSGKLPFGQGRRIVGEEPSSQIRRRGGRVGDFDPVRAVAIAILQPAAVFREELREPGRCRPGLRLRACGETGETTERQEGQALQETHKLGRGTHRLIPETEGRAQDIAGPEAMGFPAARRGRGA